MTKDFMSALSEEYLRDNKIFSGNTMFINDYMREQPVDVRATVPSNYGSDFLDVNQKVDGKKSLNEILRLFDIRR